MACAATKFRRKRSGSDQVRVGSFCGQDDLVTLQHQLQEMKDKVCNLVFCAYVHRESKWPSCLSVVVD